MEAKLKYKISTIILIIVVTLLCFTKISISPLVIAGAIVAYISSVILLVIDREPIKSRGFFKITYKNDKLLSICDNEEKATEIIDNSDCETKVTFIAFKKPIKNKDYLKFFNLVNKNH